MVEALSGVLAGLLLLWLVLQVMPWRTKPEKTGLRDALRLLPDLIRLLCRLAADPVLPRGVRVRLALLLGYLALPIDLIPNFFPVLGYAADAIVVALALRSVIRRAGPDALVQHWPRTSEGLGILHRLAQLPPPFDHRARGVGPGR